MKPTRKLFALIGFFAMVFFIPSCKKNDAAFVTKTDNLTTTSTTTALESVSTVASFNSFSFTATNNVIKGYWLYTPANATSNMPLIVYLHGGSGRGTNLNLVITGSLPKFLYDGTVKDIPAYILIPQCPSNKTWEQIATSLLGLIDSIKNTKQINASKISLTGHSLGGSGTWKLGATYATRFSCIAPLSGSVQTSQASRYINLPVWAFVGSADATVSPVSSTTIVPMINSLGGNAQLKIYNGATHTDIPGLTYKDTSVNLLNWMISKTR